MATYSTRREPLLTCPYNPAHQVKSGRLAIHITKCRKEYPEKDLRQCPFSADHVVPASELNRHIDACPFKTTVERFLTVPADNGGPSSGVPVPPSAPPQDGPDEENWENDMADAPATLEEKIPTPACGPFFADVQPMTPAQRRQYYAAWPREADELSSGDKKPEVEEESSGEGPSGASSKQKTVHRPMTKQLPKPWNRVAAAGSGGESSGDVEKGEGALKVPHVSHKREFVGATRNGGGRGVNIGIDPSEKEIQFRMMFLGLGRGRGLRRN